MNKLLATLMAFGLFLTACDNKKEESTANKPTIKIGVIYPMSGNMAKFGQGAKDAAYIFFDKLKEKPLNYNYQLIWEDNQNQPAKSMTALNKLIYVDKVDAIISLFSNTGLAIAPVIKEKNLFHINGSTEKDIADGKNNFIISYDNNEMVDEMAKILSQKKLNKISIISSNSSGMIDMINTFEQKVNSTSDLKIINKHFINSGERDFSFLITQTIDAGADIILLQMYSPEMDIFMKQYLEKNISIPVSSLSAFQYLNNKQLAEGIWYIDAAFPKKEYVEQYKERTDKDVTDLSEYFYTELEIITNLYEQFSTKPSGQEIAEYLTEKQKIDNTVIGNLNILKEGYIFAQPSLITIQDGKPIAVEE